VSIFWREFGEIGGWPCSNILTSSSVFQCPHSGVSMERWVCGPVLIFRPVVVYFSVHAFAWIWRDGCGGDLIFRPAVVYCSVHILAGILKDGGVALF